MRCTVERARPTRARDLPEAQAGVLAFERAQDVRRARDHLDLVFVGGLHACDIMNSQTTGDTCCLHDGTG